MEARHTPGPWSADGARIYSADKTLIATAAYFRAAPEEKANVEFIVRACNSYDDLVQTLSGIESLLRTPASPIRTKALAAEAELARAVISKAMGAA